MVRINKDDSLLHTPTPFIKIVPPTPTENRSRTLSAKDSTEFIIYNVCRSDVGTDSSWSYFMQKDIRYYFQHPYVRIFVAYCVIFCNFFIYAEDPITHSVIECKVPVLGNTFALFFTRYPSNRWSVLKVMMALISIGAGIYLGYLVHTYIFNKLLKLHMFFDHKGTWMTMFFCTFITSLLSSYIYTGFLIGAGVYTKPWRLSNYLGISNAFFTKIAATGTWLGDAFTACMITDMMLQDYLYPQWSVRLRRCWRRGYFRIYLFWLVICTSTTIVVTVIATDALQWDSFNKNLFHTGEMSRTFLASFILCMDFTIVIQDWDFPHFIGDFDVKLPGINVPNLRLTCLKYIRIHITGKWFNYGILFFVMLLDLNMWKNQIFYVPRDFGQYTGPDSRIYTPRDSFTLSNTKNATYFNYAWRNVTIDPLTNKTYISADLRMNARYHSTTFPIKAMAFLPSLMVIFVFFVLIARYGREKPAASNPFVGRLKKRKLKHTEFDELELSLRNMEMSSFTVCDDGDAPMIHMDGCDDPGDHDRSKDTDVFEDSDRDERQTDTSTHDLLKNLEDEREVSETDGKQQITDTAYREDERQTDASKPESSKRDVNLEDEREVSETDGKQQITDTAYREDERQTDASKPESSKRDVNLEDEREVSETDGKQQITDTAYREDERQTDASKPESSKRDVNLEDGREVSETDGKQQITDTAYREDERQTDASKPESSKPDVNLEDADKQINDTAEDEISTQIPERSSTRRRKRRKILSATEKNETDTTVIEELVDDSSNVTDKRPRRRRTSSRSTSSSGSGSGYGSSSKLTGDTNQQSLSSGSTTESRRRRSTRSTDSRKRRRKSRQVSKTGSELSLERIGENSHVDVTVSKQ